MTDEELDALLFNLEHMQGGTGEFSAEEALTLCQAEMLTAAKALRALRAERDAARAQALADRAFQAENVRLRTQRREFGERAWQRGFVTRGISTYSDLDSMPGLVKLDLDALEHEFDGREEGRRSDADPD